MTPLGAAARCPLLLLTCALSMTSPYSEGPKDLVVLPDDLEWSGMWRRENTGEYAKTSLPLFNHTAMVRLERLALKSRCSLVSKAASRDPLSNRESAREH